MRRLSDSLTANIFVWPKEGGSLPSWVTSQQSELERAVKHIGMDVLDEYIGALDNFTEMSVTFPADRENIDGVFRGLWGADENSEEKPGGVMRGTYRTIEKLNGAKFNIFLGVWQNNDGRLSGYMKGKYEDGHFHGIWHCYETGNGGTLEGIYPPSNNSTAKMMHNFVGEWSTRDGQLGGYIKSTLHSFVPINTFERPQPIQRIAEAALV